MRDEHVTDILEGAPLSRLSESDLAAVRAHAARCAECRRAYEAARVSSLLLKEHAALSSEPPPFFQTRVLAALRERREAGEGWSFARLWKATGALVASMAVTVAALAALTFTVPGNDPQPPAQGDARAFNPYSDEALFVAQDDTAGAEVEAERVIATIYGPEEDAEGDDGQDY
jgi:hypothetical protein